MRTPGRAARTGPPIRTSGLTKRYGRRTAVDALDLTVEAGEIFGFLGPNGAGKTTTIRVLLGLLAPTAGRAELFGQPCSSPLARADRAVGALVESPAFYDYMSARANLATFARLSGGATRAELDRAFSLVGLTGRDRDRVRSYSHGMRQRLGLAQALLPLPRLLIVDEPALGLDPQGLADIRDLLAGINAHEGVTVFLSSHLLHEVEQICTDVGVIIGGRMVARGKVDDLLSRQDAPVFFRVDEPEPTAAFLRRVVGVVSAEPRGQGVEIICPRELIPQLNRMLVEHDRAVYAIEPRAPTLEQFYMALAARQKPHAAGYALPESCGGRDPVVKPPEGATQR